MSLVRYHPQVLDRDAAVAPPDPESPADSHAHAGTTWQRAEWVVPSPLASRGQERLEAFVRPNVGAASTGVSACARDFPDLVVLEPRREDVGGAVAHSVDDQRDRSVVGAPDCVARLRGRDWKGERMQGARLYRLYDRRRPVEQVDVASAELERQRAIDELPTLGLDLPARQQLQAPLASQDVPTAVAAHVDDQTALGD